MSGTTKEEQDEKERKKRVTFSLISLDEAATFLFDNWVNEPESVVFDIDGGTCGRPLSVSGIRKTFEPISMPKWQCFDSVSFGVFVEGALAGHISLKPRLYHEDQLEAANVALVYVVQEQRGKGYGSELLRYSCQQMLESRNPSIVIQVLVANRNERAQKFYKNCGFVIFNPNYSVWNGVEFSLLRLNTKKDQ